MSSKEKTESVVVGVRVSRDLLRWVKAAATNEGLSVSAMVRRELLRMSRKQKGKAA